jgi:bla regulator protein BlaR1
MMISLSAVATHLWQSTLFATAVGLGTLALRRNRAAIRHAAWFAASLKFLVPFAALMAIGAQLAPRRPVVVTSTELVVTLAPGPRAVPPPPIFDMPVLSPREWPMPPLSVVAPIWLAGTLIVLGVWCVRWRRVAAIAAAARTIEHGREVDALRCLERSVGITTPLRVAESQASLEPGIVGIRRPVLVWPRTFGDRLDEAQMTTILAHEVSHVRRRDNVTAAVHMIVEAMFWFHPLVWWLGARLVDERERACDEAVVRMGGERQVYAQSILTACRVCLEAPLACVSGVTGSDLRKRIERIMLETPSDALTAWKKLILAAVPLAALVGPIVFGVLNAPRLRAESRFYKVLRPHPGPVSDQEAQFEVAAVKPNKTGNAKVMIQTQPGGRFTAENVTLRTLIMFAYRLQPLQLVGGPSWLDSDRFDVHAKADGDPGDLFDAERRGETSRPQLMLRTLLQQRFNLEVHTESRELPIYGLVRARNDGKMGPALQPATADCTPSAPAAPSGRMPCGITIGRGPGTMIAGGATMAQLARTLTTWVGRIVFDRTELPGAFDFTLTWTPDQMPQGFDKKVAAGGLAPPDPDGPSIFTALQEQLGLKLDARKAPVDVLIVDRAERPKEN